MNVEKKKTNTKDNKPDRWERVKANIDRQQFLQILQVTPPYNKLMRILSNAKKPLDKIEITNAMLDINMMHDINPMVDSVDQNYFRKEQILKRLCIPITDMLLYLCRNGLVMRHIATTPIGKYKTDVAYFVLQERRDLLDEFKKDEKKGGLNE